MKRTLRAPLSALICLLPCLLAGQQVWVHFIHGSKPQAGCRQQEKKWRGGLWGGHVGVEVDSNQVLDFYPTSRRVHVLPHRRHPVGKFQWRSREGFWRYFGLPSDSLKRSSVCLPATAAQQERLRAIAQQWAEQSPYDYAFIGVRCTSASYELLMSAGLLPERGRGAVILANFHPRQLRKHLLRRASREGWPVVRRNGTLRRIWAK
ncbi:MAG TPA: hypothetical protein PK971_12115 [Saprospiraceae bacterium]|nr:hypothetical protein [Saprospiraceae bacterium]HND89071.1 hypothetical protein [Saprospiraceae bacterium]